MKWSSLYPLTETYHFATKRWKQVRMYFPISVENDHLQVFQLNSDFHRTWRNKDSHNIIPQSIFNCKRQNDSIAIVVEWNKCCERDSITCYLFRRVSIFLFYQSATLQLFRITKAPFIIVVTKKPKFSSSVILSFIKSVLFTVWKENFHLRLHLRELRLMKGSRTANHFTSSIMLGPMFCPEFQGTIQLKWVHIAFNP